MGILLLSSDFVIQVPSTAAELFLCPSGDASRPSNLLAGTSPKAGKGVAGESDGLQWVRRELAVTLLLEDFPFPSLGRPPGRDVSIMGVSLTQDHGPHGRSGTDSIPWRITHQ